jgi:hypothetical protein
VFRLLILATGLLVLSCVCASAGLAQTTLSAPDHAVGAPSTSVVVSVLATPADGTLGLDMELDYSSSVLQATSVSKTAISQGFTLTYNIGSPGRVIVSLFGTTPLSGSGAVVDITFDVVGTQGAQSALDLVSGQINEGAIETVLDDGLFTVCTGAFPSEVAGLGVQGKSPTTVSWDTQGDGFEYDVAGGTFAQLGTDGGAGGATCLADDVASTSYVDPRPDPAGGSGYYYIVRAQSSCGSGTYGFSSSGAERNPLAACP